MDTQNSYKRTVAGSVGAGMGALFNGSGRTYYMLEHKTSSKYHQAGETQKIIIDQVELGRDASCQVRYDESFETVSRKHAAIERDGSGWKLVHLSQSNPTFINGQPVQGSQQLKNGDEIQLSEGGPRLGFIVPQGKQALTSSIRLTERMNLFRQQALRPYRRALWALGALLLLVIAGFGYWNYELNQENKLMRRMLAIYQAQIDTLAMRDALLAEKQDSIQAELKDNPTDKKLNEQLNQVQRERAQVRYVYRATNQVRTKLQDVFDDDEKEVEKPKLLPVNPVPELEKPVVITPAPPVPPEPEPTPVNVASDNIENYYNDIYTLKVKKITLEYGGNSYDAGIATSNIVVGTGFVMNGKFVTARSNIQPWVYRYVYTDAWRNELAEYIAAGFKVIIDFEAYSTRGTGYPLTFSNTQFDLASLEAFDAIETVIIDKPIRKKIRLWGIDFTYKKSNYEMYKATYYTDKSHNVAVLSVGAPGGLPVDRAASQNLKGAEDVTIAGFSGNTNIHNLDSYVKYFTSKTSRAPGFTFITLQEASNNWGYTGSPAFYKNEEGKYRVIGVNVGNFGGELRLVPICNVN